MDSKCNWSQKLRGCLKETALGEDRIIEAYRRGVKPPVPYSRFYFHNWETGVPTVVEEDIVGGDGCSVSLQR